MFNTLHYTKKLEAAGISREQAEAHVQIIAEIVEDDVATKKDLRDFEYRLVFRLSTVIGAVITIVIAITATITKLL
jgi:hypothetical protein